MALTESVVLEYETITTPKLVSNNDVYNTQKFVLQKPKWVEDAQVSACVKCNSKFTQLKRRHHCRQCGNIFCNACCKERMLLPHLDYSGPERVCDNCKPLVNIFYLAFSKEIHSQQEGAKAFKTMCQNRDGVKELLCSGGIQILIYMGKINSDDIRAEVTEALNQLMFYCTLHSYLAELGAMKLLCRVLTESENSELQLAGLEVLEQFCENPELKKKAFDHGALAPLLHMCSSHHDGVALHAVTCLSSITEHPETHQELVYSSVGNALACLLSMLHSTHEPVQEKLLKILAHISFGSDYARDKIMQEDLCNGSCLCQVLDTRPLRYKSACHAACVVANIASSNVQGVQRDHLLSLCNLLLEVEFDNHMLLLRHLSRGVANCLKVPQNCDITISFIPRIIHMCLRSADQITRYNGFRSVVSLLKYLPEETIQVLSRNGSEEFLQCLCGTQDTLDTILNATLSRVDMIVQPENI